MKVLTELFQSITGPIRTSPTNTGLDVLDKKLTPSAVVDQLFAMDLIPANEHDIESAIVALTGRNATETEVREAETLLHHFKFAA